MASSKATTTTTTTTRATVSMYAWQTQYRPEMIARTAMECANRSSEDASSDDAIRAVGEGVLRRMNEKLIMDDAGVELPPKNWHWGRQTFAIPVRASMNALRTHWPSGCDWLATASAVFGELPPARANDADGAGEPRDRGDRAVSPSVVCGEEALPQRSHTVETRVDASSGPPRSGVVADERDARKRSSEERTEVARPDAKKRATLEP